MASRARWVALISYLVVQCAGLLIAVLILQVPRAALPREEISALAGAVGSSGGPEGAIAVPWPRPRITLSAPAGTFGAGELQELQLHLAAALTDEDAEIGVEAAPAENLSLDSCILSSGTADANRACLSALEDAATAVYASESLANSFHVLLVPVEGCSALLLSAGRGAVLRWAGKHLDAELAKALAAHLRETWLRRIHLEHVAALFEVAPAYVFSFFLVGDCQWRVAWHFQESLVTPFLQPFFERLGLLVDFEIDSQVVQCGSLSGPPDGAGHAVNAAGLRADFLSRAGEWPGDTATRGARWMPPLVRFVAFKHSGGLRVVDADNQEQRSFAVQGWGTVAITSENETSCQEAVEEETGSSNGTGNVKFLSACEAQQVASAWVSNLRSWLTLPPDAPVPGTGRGRATCDAAGGLALHAAKPRFDGLAEWELLRAARAFHTLFVRRAADTLENLLALVDSLPDVVVRAEIGEMAFEAAAAARRACTAAEEGNLEGALAAARRSLALALTASHDDTVVAQMYFSWEFKYAVYLPLGLPIIVPIVVALFRQLKQARKVRNLRKRPPQASMSEGAEHVR